MNNRAIKFEYGFHNHAPVKATLQEIESGLVKISDLGGVKYRRQFTGLHDKNGVEIYEGAIVNAKLCDSNGKMIGKHTGFVVFNEHEWVIEMEDDHFPLASWILVDSCQVIGNIHENPELMEDNDE